ncbi:hypothetical protein SAMN05216420_105140 [Nitrosospira sp. Nl5]|uniref:hypothetical protein n=1 Tax=Nitrosospira sp. Nl5 TaxID=200120 RepID=UPI00087F56DF|nr:hypothetical protein [Nitrosospira sp. Nl5]SCY38186.1 hypothetical protein SAMN05216420_105140 [Nitrosospira sp. Nl5]
MFKKSHSQQHNRSLENEVILAVVVLYLLLAIVMTVVHYIQPAEQETVTSSTSPSHNERSSRQIKE